MKKSLIFLLTIILMGIFAAEASAGSLGVNVPPGYVLEVDSVFTSGENYFSPAGYRRYQ